MIEIGNTMKKVLSICIVHAVISSQAFSADVNLETVRVTCPSNATEACRTAAEDLEKHLMLISGERTPSNDGWVFAVGQTPPGELQAGNFESRSKVCGNTVYFWGDEGTYGLETSQGPLFAVYEFLDKALGVRWVYPGDEGIVVTHRTSVNLEDGQEWRFVPPFEVCVIRGGNAQWRRYGRRSPGLPKEFRTTRERFEAGQKDILQWKSRMRIASVNRHLAGHAFTKWQNLYLAEHPEWFALVTHPELVRSGKSSRGVKDSTSKYHQFCHSSTGAAAAVVADWQAKGAPRRLNICLNDGKHCFCHCENCLKLDVRLPGEAFTDHLTDRVVHFYNLVMAQAVKVRPDVDACTFIYSVYRHPPRREKLLYGDNMTISYVSAFGDDYVGNMDAWQSAGMKRFYLRPNYMCYAPALPRGVEKYLYDVFQTALRHGAIGVDYDGSPAPVMNLEYYVIASAARCPSRSFDDIVNEFYGQYGAAKNIARAYYERIRMRADKFFAVASGAGARHRLDDSELGKYAVVSVSESDLSGDLEVLRNASRIMFDGLEKIRFDKLRIRAENALLTYRFLKAAAVGDEAELASAAKVLHAFRVANFEALGGDGASWFSKRGNERKAWHKAGYLKEL